METVLHFAFLLPLILSTAFSPCQATAEEITRTCASAVNKELCIKSLKSVPGSESADLSTLTEMSINLAVQNGTALLEHIKELAADSTDSFDEPRLQDCAENYSTALDQLEDALDALKTKGYEDVAAWVEAAMMDSESCEESFAEKLGRLYTIKEWSIRFQQLCGNALAIVNVLQKHMRHSH